MRLIRPTMVLLLASIALTVVYPGEASAYLDPASTSGVLQMIFAFLLSILVVVKLYARKMVNGVRSFFSSKRGSEAAEQPPDQ